MKLSNYHPRPVSTSGVMLRALQVLYLPPQYAMALGMVPVPQNHYWRPDSGGKYTRQGKVEALILQTMNRDAGIHRRINKKAALAAIIAKYQQDGRIRVEESGRDCDCVEYSGHMHECDATVRAFEKLSDDIYQWADGPFRLTIVPWDAQIERTSRDLVLEAHEDGHPHSIVSRFP